MDRREAGMLARSLAGHDKGHTKSQKEKEKTCADDLQKI